MVDEKATPQQAPVRFGIIGAGYWGANVIRTLAGIRECEVAYVCDLKPGRREFIREQFPHLTIAEDHNQIIEDPTVDAVAIVTPVVTHAELARQVLLAGKHVYVEKPFTSESSSAAALTRLATEQKRKILVGHLFEYHPAVEKLKELLDNECIGEVYTIDAARMNMRPPETEVNVVWDLAPHDLSIIYYLLGGQPERISAYGQAFVNPALEDSVHARLQFAAGVYAALHLSWLTANRTRCMTIFGSRGVIVYDDMQPVDKIRVYAEGIDSRVGTNGNSKRALSYQPGDITIPAVPAGQPLDRECRHFIQCIREGGSVRSDGLDGYHVVRTIELINKSIQAGGSMQSMSHAHPESYSSTEYPQDLH